MKLDIKLTYIQKYGKPEKVDKNKILIARPSVNREAPPPHPHQWLNAYFRSGSENRFVTN